MNLLKNLIFGSNIREEKSDQSEMENSTQKLIPVSDIRSGVIITRDGRFIKVLEVLPVNFYLKSPIDQANIIYYYTAFLKVAPDNLQIRVVTQKADIEGYTARMRHFCDTEPNPLCREMILDNIREVNYLAASEAVTRRFFLIFQYEPRMKAKAGSMQDIAGRLKDEANTARRYLALCGLQTVDVTYEDNFLLDLLYRQFNKKTSRTAALPYGVFDMMTDIHGVYVTEDREDMDEEKEDC